VDVIDEYVKVLEQLELSLSDEEIAEKFPLWDLLIANDGQREHAAAIEAYEARRAGRPAPKAEAAGESLINPADAVPQ
jgi:hypothetical protein